MPTYKYVAVNSLGKKVKDVIDAESIGAARDAISDSGLFPTNINELTGRARKRSKQTTAKGNAAKRGNAYGGITIGGVSSKQLNSFTRQLSTLISADVPIVRSLKILESQMKMCLFKKNLHAMIVDIEEGASLSSAMVKHKRAFSKIYVNTIKAGEVGGMLDETLARLADFLDKVDRLRRKIISAMTYPVAVIIIAMSIVVGIMVFIIPNFVQMFDDMNVAGGLPIMTQIVVQISAIVASYWYVLIAFPFGAFILKGALSKIRRVKLVIDMAIFKIPLFGKLINKSAISTFCRTLATLIIAGVPILDALANTKDATKNEALASAIENIRRCVREGGAIGEPLRQSRIVDEMVINMIEVGEETGVLDKMLLKVADNMDAEIDATVDAITSLIEPALIVFLGGSIGFIVIAMFMPMIRLMQNLG